MTGANTPIPSPAAIRAVRVARGLTQVEAAAELGVHEITWVRWETGSRTPTGLARAALKRWVAGGES